MPRPGLSPLRQRQLIDATVVALHRHGLGQATVARIGRAAGFSPALVHHDFPDKDALLAATMRTLLRELRREVVAALARADGPRERLLALIEADLAPSQLRPEVIAAWLSFWAAAPHSPALGRLQRIYALRLRRHLYRELRRLIPDAQAWPAALGAAALIDGLYLRCALGGAERLAPATARALARDYLDRQMAAAPAALPPAAATPVAASSAGSRRLDG